MKKLIKKLVPGFLFDIYHLFLAYFGAFLYGWPSKKMVVIGVLGTRGKTTTADFIWSCLQASGKKAGLTGTANIRIGNQETLNPYHMTMPGRFILQKILRQMVKSGCEYAVIETPSEGVEQSRHKGIIYDVAVLTTLYPEYAEAHHWSWERTLAMHQKVFADLGKQYRKKINGREIPKIIVVQSDNALKDDFLKFNADKKITYGISKKADFEAKYIESLDEGISFEVNGEKYELSLAGGFNVLNALAAVAAATALGIPNETIKKGLLNLKKVAGRLEQISVGQTFHAIVDYAHDSVSLEAALKAAKEIGKNSSKIILLLGAEGGGRDKKKRPIMGEVAAKLADYVVVSNVDPYDDDPIEIIEDIAAAAEKAGKKRNVDLFTIADRREGIRHALKLAKTHDVVLITGKGAEQSLIIKGKSYPWDDREVVRQELLNIV